MVRNGAKRWKQATAGGALGSGPFATSHRGEPAEPTRDPCQLHSDRLSRREPERYASELKVEMLLNYLRLR